MTQFAIYSHQLGFDKVVRIVQETLPTARIEVDLAEQRLIGTHKGGLFGKTRTFRLSYRQRRTPSYTLGEIDGPLAENLSGMVNYVRSIPAQNEAIRDRLIYKVMATNCEIGCVVEPKLDDTLAPAVHRLLTELNGFIFAGADPYFGSSDRQQFLDKRLELILDTAGRSAVADLDVTVDAKYHDTPQEGEITEEQTARRDRTNALLIERGIQVPTFLPCLPAVADLPFRPVEEVIDRAYGLLVTAAKGEGIEQQHLERVVAEKSITSLSPQEEEIYRTEELTPQQRAYASWRYESLHVLLWALGTVDRLQYPSDTCDVCDTVRALLNPTREDFTNSVHLRSPYELLDELDQTYRMHWACVNARLRKEEVGGALDCSVVYERHYALNWLVDLEGDGWDDVRTDT
ncbi:DUF4272 domain-containing protein [Neolewinella sp.]|uniref:DUF4272 domain-containing protein n=1 Tax=Neolewinella sp. TaxID=2993543 RepID=UPI003B520BD2